MRVKDLGWRAEKLRGNFGSGYGASALVGVASGLHRFAIGAGGVLSDELTMPSVGTTWFDYYYDFFIARTTGAEERFLIPWRSKWWHVRFVENEMSWEKFRDAIYTGSLELEQVRVPAFSSYNSDGSVVLV